MANKTKRAGGPFWVEPYYLSLAGKSQHPKANDHEEDTDEDNIERCEHGGVIRGYYG